MSDSGAARTSRIHRWRSDGTRDVAVAVSVVTFGSLLVLATGVRGADYPAQLLREELWNDSGFGVWNNYWYGGHPTLSYSLITPLLMGIVGSVALCIGSSIIATWCFADLLRSTLPGRRARWGAVVFALAAVVNVVVGRVAFAAGLALALAAVWAWYRHVLWAAVFLAFVTPLASPVAATFLAIAAAAVCCDALWPTKSPIFANRLRRAWPSVAIGVATTAPLFLMAFAVGSGSGTFPFRGGHFAMSMIVLAVTGLVYRQRVIRIAVAFAAVASIVLFVVPTPLGGNVVRFAQFIAVPLLVAGVARPGDIARPRLRMASTVIAIVGTGWMLQHASAAVVTWAGDGSTDYAYHQPLIDEVVRRNAEDRAVGRVEIPFTANHWESYHVAAAVPFTRGWERQVDLDRNGVLYDNPLTAADYREWLDHRGVRWVALPDAPLDHGGRAEADLLEGAEDIPWLDLVWQNEHWQLYEVSEYQPIVDAPMELVSQSPDEVVVSSPEAGTVTVRYVYTEQARVSGGGCVAPAVGPADDRWMSLTVPTAGTYTIRVEPGAVLSSGGADRCDGS